jgi:hypothetical protein
MPSCAIMQAFTSVVCVAFRALKGGGGMAVVIDGGGARTAIVPYQSQWRARTAGGRGYADKQATETAKMGGYRSS